MAEKTAKSGELYKGLTKSHIPKTPREKKMWIAARRIGAALSGHRAALTPGQWGLVTTIYKNAKKANKIPKLADWKKAKVSKAVKRYKISPNQPKQVQKDELKEFKKRYRT